MWEPPDAGSPTSGTFARPCRRHRGGDPLRRPGAATRIEIEHRGWERLGTVGARAARAEPVGWESLLPHFRTAIERGGS